MRHTVTFHFHISNQAYSESKNNSATGRARRGSIRGDRAGHARHGGSRIARAGHAFRVVAFKRTPSVLKRFVREPLFTTFYISLN